VSSEALDFKAACRASKSIDRSTGTPFQTQRQCRVWVKSAVLDIAELRLASIADIIRPA